MKHTIQFERNDGGRDTDGFSHETGDCTVRAVALATNTEYKHAHALLRKWGRKDRSGIFFDVFMNENKELFGYKAERVNIGRGMTVNKFSRGYIKGTYLVRVPCHVFVQKDGVILDTGLSGKRTRVRQAWKLTRTY